MKPLLLFLFFLVTSFASFVFCFLGQYCFFSLMGRFLQKKKKNPSAAQFLLSLLRTPPPPSFVPLPAASKWSVCLFPLHLSRCRLSLLFLRRCWFVFQQWRVGASQWPCQGAGAGFGDGCWRGRRTTAARAGLGCVFFFLSFPPFFCAFLFSPVFLLFHFSLLCFLLFSWVLLFSCFPVFPRFFPVFPVLFVPFLGLVLPPSFSCRPHARLWLIRWLVSSG